MSHPSPQHLSANSRLNPRQDPSPTSSDPAPTATSSSPSPTPTSSPAPSSSQTDPQPTPTSTSTNAQPTASSSSRSDQPTTTATSSPAPSSTPTQISTSDPPAQSSSNSQSSAANTSSPSPASPSPSPQPGSNTFSSQPPAASSSQASSQIVVVTSNVYRTSADPSGGIHTLTSYVEVTVDRPASTVVAPGATSIAQLHDGETHQPGFFDNRGAVIGTFLTVGLIVLGGSAAIIWRLARLRRARQRARADQDAEVNFDKFVGTDDDGRVAMLPLESEHEDFQNIALSREPQLPQIDDAQLGPQFSNQPGGDPMLGYLDNPVPVHSNMQEVYPIRFSNRTGRSSDLDTMNPEEWGRYINTHFATTSGGARAYGDASKPELVRVDEEGAGTAAGPPIIISSEEHGSQGLLSFHPSPDPQPEIQTVEEETFKMVSPPQFTLDDQIPTTDERLEPTVLPGYHLQRPESGQQDELASLRDDEDYSRRILRVSNPDLEEKQDQPSKPHE
ncbi:hypothetical protein PGT21_026253 [Puccinia graminis f. sp. tritici]|uniref:Uncharacterized protein n=2 Tax=Puccinia graminis f. sp. tritici TaxID=56615 RepID=E3KNW2_PUCGT|nr:uncharacterized protein PGTG_11743 [Puccinia graminis f. sp. tritici CRL 75-36-700-3]EFP85987.2 hypothetical protein PGTG_11743 [Puccinia graminis f. sp. tritici CRL 75-36-700-3]KAA1073816.1 hypothetical protein PGT21_026253 [Puccinia graminis f. sp. tritici]